MSAKKRKFLERGVIVAIFAVVMVVGALVAQQHPSHNSWKVIGNMGSFGNNKLTATVRIENDTPFANIIAIPNEETPIADRDILDFSAAAMDPLTNAAAAGGRVGNLGYVIVETNYDKWDIVVSTKYGGYLRRPIITNDPDDENEAPIYAPAIPGTQEKAPGKPNAEDIAWDDGDCVDYRVVDGTFPPQRICVEVDSVPARDVSLVGEGRYLKTSINENVRLNLTIGTLGGFGDGDGVYEFFEAMNTVFGNPASGIAAESFANISTGIQNDPATTGRVSLAATLLGGGGAPDAPGTDWTGTTMSKKVSATGQQILAADVAPTGGLEAWLGMASSPATDNYFSSIMDWHATNASGSITGISPHIERPSETYRAMAFYVNANLNAARDVIEGRHNKNGAYEEEVIFEFFGPY